MLAILTAIQAGD